MHRSTTTTATLLAAMAFSALSGCVTVQHPTAPGPAATPARPPLPGPDGRPGTQVVQAPAREALEMAGPPREQEPAAPSAERPRTAAGGPESGSRSRPHARPDRPEHRRRSQPRVEVPDVAAEVRRNTDVCALGETYGGWREDSPEAVICEQTYRR
ncbi:hypothetical protein QFZ56_001383 [Streptomyces achromogenes]|uniref:Lipoprotein n=1 Tax=Streptomyces achromogenes TaxID=67255 RepID=A0ABU0PVL5_STRAH|nr:hypothetical protein [Streptomyces achromogenes]MDQ0682420.1 hypothetical protein [Streptomyces achromogenes]